MFQHTSSMPSPVRPALESLEARAVPSATTLTPRLGAPAVRTASSGFTVDYGAQPRAAAVAAPAVNYSYSWAATPGAVIQGTSTGTASGKSSGSVAFALVRPGSDSAVLGASETTTFGYISTTSSSSVAKPDRYTNVAFSLTMTVRDTTSGATAKITFKGTLNGTVTAFGGSLKATFQTPSQTVYLGTKAYSVSLPASINLPGPRSAPLALAATVKVTNR